MNYLFIITSLNQGGAEKKLLNIIRHIKRDKSNESMLVVLKPNGKMEEEFFNEKIKIINLNLSNLFSFFSFNFFKNIINIYRFSPDYVVSWLYHSNIISIFIKFITFKSNFLIWNIRQTLNIKYFKSYNKKLIIYLQFLFSFIPDLIIFNSDQSKITHLKYLFKNNINKFKVIPNSFNSDEFYKISKDKITSLRKKYNINDKNIVISNFSRYHSMKNHELFIKISLDLLSIDSSYKIIMAGDGVLIKYKNLTNKNFIIFDNLKNINEFLNITDCVFLTSSYGESFPSILAETMLTETLPISTNVGNSKKLISDYGLIINSQYNANQIDKFIKKNYKNINLLNNARKKIINNYSIERICNYYINTIKQI